jgi:hypothetical protein
MQTEQVQELRSRLEEYERRLEEYERLNLRSLARELDGMMYIVSPDRAWPDGMTLPRSSKIFVLGEHVDMNLRITWMDGPGDIMHYQSWFRIAMKKVNGHWMLEHTDSLVDRNCVVTVKHMGAHEYVPVTCLRLHMPAGSAPCTIFKNGDQLNIRLRGDLPLSLDGSEGLSYCPLTIRIVGE